MVRDPIQYIGAQHIIQCNNYVYVTLYGFKEVSHTLSCLILTITPWIRDSRKYFRFTDREIMPNQRLSYLLTVIQVENVKSLDSI